MCLRFVLLAIFCIVMIGSCKPIARDGTDKFSRRKITETLLENLDNLIRKGKYHKAAKLADSQARGDNFVIISYVLEQQLRSGNKAGVKYFFESYVGGDIDLVNKTIGKIAEEYSAHKVIKLLEDLGEQIGKVEATFIRRQVIVEYLAASTRADIGIRNYIDEHVRTLTSLEEWADTLKVEGENALRSYAKNEKKRFGGGTIEVIDKSEDGPLDEYVMQTVRNYWLTIENKLTQIGSPAR